MFSCLFVQVSWWVELCSIVKQEVNARNAPIFYCTTGILLILVILQNIKILYISALISNIYQASSIGIKLHTWVESRDLIPRSCTESWHLQFQNPKWFSNLMQMVIDQYKSKLKIYDIKKQRLKHLVNHHKVQICKITTKKIH